MMPLALPYGLQLVGLALIGAVIGSFLNVVIHRLPIMIERADEDVSEHPSERYDLALPPSGCPHCGHRLRPWENIPLLSYLLLRGRCSACATAIGWQYPVVETIAAAVGPLAVLQFGLTERGLAATVFVWFMIAITVIDLRHLLIPDLLSLPLLWLGLLLSTRSVFVTPEAAIIGAVGGYLAFRAIDWAGSHIAKRPVMGWGDAKLFAAIGAWTGGLLLPQVALVACVFGSVIGITLVLTGRHDRSQPVPFGPFLVLGGLAALFRGRDLLGFWGF